MKNNRPMGGQCPKCLHSFFDCTCKAKVKTKTIVLEESRPFNEKELAFKALAEYIKENKL